MSLSVGLQNLTNISNNYGYLTKKDAKSASSNVLCDSKPANVYYKPINFCSSLTPSEKQKYDYLLNYMQGYKISQTSGNKTVQAQLETLLKSGKLLEKSANDKSSILDNLYEIATTKRAHDLDSKNLISNTLDIILNPAIITQNFGDIPHNDKVKILQHLDNNSPVKKDPSLMDISASGTCVAASNEVNLADKYPAEFSRWVNKLSSTDKGFTSRIKVDSISRNPLEALMIFNLLKADMSNFNFNTADIKVKPDENAYIRAKNQDKNWDLGERNVADVLVQSAIMQLGSQGTYDSLTDIRGGELTDNPQGLIEVEKTFVESVIKNKEIESFVNQQIDDNKRLVGYNSSFEKLKNDIINVLDSGDDLIVGYVLTNESAGITESKYYNKETDGDKNLIINGHEITVVGYRKDENGNTVFSCIDTDDDNPNIVEYSAQWLIPKINHVGMPVHVKKSA